MKKLMLLFAACVCTISSAFAATVVFVDETGVYVEQTDLSCEEIYENAQNSTYDGEVTCWDFNVTQNGGTDINGTAIPSVSIQKQMELSNQGEPSTEKASVPLLMFNNKNGTHLVRIGKKSNRQALLKAFGDGNSINGAKMIWVKPSLITGKKKAKNINVNGKAVSIVPHVVTVSYGDIIIGGMSMEGYED